MINLQKQKYLTTLKAQQLCCRYRQNIGLHIYVSFSRIITEHHKLARAAITNNDRDFFLNYFKEKAGDPAFIVDNLQRELDPHEIDAVLTLLGLARPDA